MAERKPVDDASGERDLKVIFSREGAAEEVHIVRDGDQALKVALHLITGQDALRAGDALTVVWYHRPGLVERRLA